MKQGDKITEMGEEIEKSGWIEAVVKGRRGLVPAEYIKKESIY